MAKKITGIIKLQIPAGQANPAPPVGPALGQHGVNIMGFCKEPLIPRVCSCRLTPVLLPLSRFTNARISGARP